MRTPEQIFDYMQALPDYVDAYLDPEKYGITPEEFATFQAAEKAEKAASVESANSERR